MNYDEIIDLDKEYVANTYKRFNIALKKGEGSTLYDFNDKKYIDFGSGIAVNIFGANFKPWNEAIINQLTNIAHTSNLYYSAPQVRLAKMLCDKTGFKRVFFSNSGAEANEGAIKVARKYSMDKYGANRYEIITLVNSFHGRTMATLSATGQDHFHQYFNPFLEGFVHAIANDINDLESKINDKTCAIMLETIQGEGGILCLDSTYVKKIYELCQNKDILLIVDEVQTGNGRTGELYSYMYYDIKPDIITTAKGLGGGLPIGAIMLGDKVYETLKYGDHGSTFGGNLISCSGAVAILENITDEVLNDVKRKSKIIFDYLENIKGVRSVSGRGLMIGIETEKNASDIANKCIEKGLIVLTAKTKVRLLPALNITDKELLDGLKILKEVIEE